MGAKSAAAAPPPAPMQPGIKERERIRPPNIVKRPDRTAAGRQAAGQETFTIKTSLTYVQEPSNPTRIKPPLPPSQTLSMQQHFVLSVAQCGALCLQEHLERGSATGIRSSHTGSSTGWDSAPRGSDRHDQSSRHRLPGAERVNASAQPGVVRERHAVTHKASTTSGPSEKHPGIPAHLLHGAKGHADILSGLAPGSLLPGIQTLLCASCQTVPVACVGCQGTRMGRGIRNQRPRGSTGTGCMRHTAVTNCPGWTGGTGAR